MEIWQLTATQVASAVRTGALSAQEVTGAVLARIEDVNPTVNALVEVHRDSGEPPFPMGADAQSSARSVELMGHQWPSMSIAMLGLPALGLPSLAREGGAPLGVQVIGRPFEEDAVLTAGEVIQARLGVLTPVNPRTGGS